MEIVFKKGYRNRSVEGVLVKRQLRGGEARRKQQEVVSGRELWGGQQQETAGGYRSRELEGVLFKRELRGEGG